MKKNNLVFNVLALSLVIGLWSCKQKIVDVEKPVITIKAPKDHAQLLIGNEHGVHFDMELSDNEALASYKINIHANFGDGHQHAPRQRVIVSAASNDSIPYEFTKIWTNIAGQKSASIHHHEIVIPKTINGKPVKAGDYHLVVYCLDKAGNENHIAVDVELTYNAEADKDHHHEH